LLFRRPAIRLRRDRFPILVEIPKCAAQFLHSLFRADLCQVNQHVKAIKSPSRGDAPTAHNPELLSDGSRVPTSALPKKGSSFEALKEPVDKRAPRLNRQTRRSPGIASSPHVRCGRARSPRKWGTASLTGGHMPSIYHPFGCLTDGRL